MTLEPVMNPTTRITIEEYLRLPEEPGKRFELDEGTLVAKPTLTFRQSLIRQQIAERLRDFVKKHRLGEITLGTDFCLGPKTVRNPDIAFVTTEHLKNIDIDISPAPGAPALVIEVVSPDHSVDDLMAKIRQYLAAGSRAVWMVYPGDRLVEIHDAAGTREVFEPALLKERGPFGEHTFSLLLTSIFNEDTQ
jgi:Uma2 family endonuclease